jgi:hypothetical protein
VLRKLTPLHPQSKEFFKKKKEMGSSGQPVRPEPEEPKAGIKGQNSPPAG